MAATARSFDSMMGSLSPAALAVLIAIGVAMVGAILVYFRNRARFRGYEDIAADAARIARFLKGEIFRDGRDLVATGNLGTLPTVVRFSNDENLPGLNIRMQAPVTFTLWTASRSTEHSEGRVMLRTSDMIFDARFVTRSDHPTQARMFLSMQKTSGYLQKLCCSSKTFVAISRGTVELSELAIPQPYTANHVLDHLQTMSAMAEAMREMPGADTVRIQPLQKQTEVLGRTMIAVGLVAVVALVVAATRPQFKHRTVVVASAERLPLGVRPADAAGIAGIMQWRLATVDDFDRDAAAWVRSFGQTAAGRIPGDFSGSGQGLDSAYVLVDKNGMRRVVLLENGQNRFDARYASLAIVARVPKGNVSGIEWSGPAPANPDGDGLLIVRAANDPKSGVVLFTSGQRLVSGIPADYQSIHLD